MTEKLLKLHADEVWRTMATIDPVAVMAEDLIGRTIARAGHERNVLGRLVPWSPRPGAGPLTDPVVLEHPVEMPVCVASARILRTAQAAALAALAARELLVPGGVTVAMLGITGPVQRQLSVIARHVPDISHVALWADGPDGVGRLDPELVDQLDLSGIGLSVAPSITDAVFGANLVIAAGDGTRGADLENLELGHLSRGTVLINATGHDLPGAPVDAVDRVYVDDIGLLPAHRDNRVAAAHLMAAATENGADGPGDHRTVSDLGQLLTGRDTGHCRADEVLRVELFGVDELNVELAYRIYRAASQRGLGVHILTNGG